MITLILITVGLYLSGLLCGRMAFIYTKEKAPTAIILLFLINTIIITGTAIALTVKLFKDYT